MQVIKTSPLTGVTHTMDLDVTKEQLDRFEIRKETGEYVQNIFNNLSASEREFILSGITPTEWDKTFNN